MAVKLSPPRMMGSAAAATRIAVLGGMAIVTAEIERPCVVSHSGNTVSERKRRDIFHSCSVKMYLKCCSSFHISRSVVWRTSVTSYGHGNTAATIDAHAWQRGPRRGRVPKGIWWHRCPTGMAQQAGGPQAFSSTSGLPHANLFHKNTL
jgi:hypothetical protein